jgi:hypothetical protein
MKKQWFSARLRFAIILEKKGLVRFSDSIFLFKSGNFEDAFKRILEIGHSKQKSYVNDDDLQVAWKLVEVISLDIVRFDSLEGAEVYSEPVSGTDPLLRIEHEFHPELSEPTQTV